MESLFNKSGKDLEKSKISSNYVPRFKTIADIKIKAISDYLQLLDNRVSNLEEELIRSGDFDMNDVDEPALEEDKYVNTS